ncbi:hypothetical protein [Pseudomonas aeruginosa]|uniref:hypothetical protein n=1 Tax=Pseudomonas aeruginosa TaxID=287 RepID=UPI00135F6C31|nr:hypothetical protein [Pseudomonas aeruginosa]MWW08608.1 hypothetical protein [Pseudomonas aeruginosa]
MNKALVEQAGGDERAAFEQWLEQHMSHHFSPELDLAKYEDSGEYRYNPAADYWKAWQARAALAQPSPAQAEAERPEVVARVVHSNPVVLGQCGPLNANDELMTVAQHAASVARWAEIFNRVEQQRDAALASFKNFHRLLCERFGYTHDEKDWQRDQLSLIEHIAAAQAQHSVPEEFIGRLSEFLAQRGATGKALLRELRDMLAAAPVCRLSRSALTDAQMRRLYDSSTETENERLGFAAFARLIRRAEAVHQIAAAPGKEGA